MSHDNADEIICPYCDFEFEDSWEYGHRGDSTIDCQNCDKQFDLKVEEKWEFSTSRVECAEDKHVWGEVGHYDYDEDRIRNKHLENPRLWKIEPPYTLWFRDCDCCEESEVKKVAFKAECPFPAEALP